MAVLTRLAAAARRRFGSADPDSDADSDSDSEGTADQPPHGDPAVIGARSDGAAESHQPFTGRLDRLDRLGSVSSGTVVVVFEAGSDPSVRGPGELLIPSLFPFVAGIEVLPVNTEPIELTVRVKDLTTMDGQSIDHIDLAVTVQLTGDDDHAAVKTLVGRQGSSFGSYLMREVGKAVEGRVRGAVRTNALRALREQSVQQILEDRWMPSSFAGDALRQQGFAVREVAWTQRGDEPSREDSDAGADEPASDPPRQSTRPAGSERGRRVLELSLDARLARIWRANCDAPLLGIASATVREAVTVVAVSERQPGAFDHSRLSELFGDLLLDRRLCLVITGGTSYDQVVRDWFAQVSTEGAVVSVETVEHGDILRVHLDAPLPTADRSRRGHPSPDGSEGQALLHVLPFFTIEFASDVPLTPRAAIDPDRPEPA